MNPLSATSFYKGWLTLNSRIAIDEEVNSKHCRVMTGKAGTESQENQMVSFKCLYQHLTMHQTADNAVKLVNFIVIAIKELR